jgi:AcrR family transcriptional regulator
VAKDQPTASETRPRGPYAKTAARRAEIIRAARDSFAENGYGGSSLRDIAVRAGITHAGLLHHFRDKDELLAAVLAQRDTEEWEEGVARVDRPQAVLPHLTGLLRRHQQSPELMRLWSELAAAASRPDHPAHTYFVERYEQARLNFAEGMRGNQVLGTLREDLDPQTAATLLQALLNGLQLLWLLSPELDIISPLERFAALILDPDQD